MVNTALLYKGLCYVAYKNIEGKYKNTLGTMNSALLPIGVELLNMVLIAAEEKAQREYYGGGDDKEKAKTLATNSDIILNRIVENYGESLLINTIPKMVVRHSPTATVTFYDFVKKELVTVDLSNIHSIVELENFLSSLSKLLIK